jgi:hypothetical protein
VVVDNPGQGLDLPGELHHLLGKIGVLLEKGEGALGELFAMAHVRVRPDLVALRLPRLRRTDQARR